jgi:hypothetical protein
MTLERYAEEQHQKATSYLVQCSRLFYRIGMITYMSHHKNQTTKKSEAVTNKMALSLINYFVWENDVGHVLLLFSFQHAASCFSPLASY